MKYFRKVAKKVIVFDGPPASSPPCAPGRPVFKKNMRKGSAPRGRRWKTHPFWYPGMLPARKNQEYLRAVPSGPTGGLSGKKIGVGAVMFLRLPFPNQRPGARFHRRGGLRPPKSLPLQGGRCWPKARRMRILSWKAIRPGGETPLCGPKYRNNLPPYI